MLGKDASIRITSPSQVPTLLSLGLPAMRLLCVCRALAALIRLLASLREGRLPTSNGLGGCVGAG